MTGRAVLRTTTNKEFRPLKLPCGISNFHSSGSENRTEKSWLRYTGVLHYVHKIVSYIWENTGFCCLLEWPQQGEEMGWQSFMNFNKGSTKSYPLGRNNPRHQEQVAGRQLCRKKPQRCWCTICTGGGNMPIQQKEKANSLQCCRVLLMP